MDVAKESEKPVSGMNTVAILIVRVFHVDKPSIGGHVYADSERLTFKKSLSNDHWIVTPTA